jgi:hypothetical protein
MSGQEWFAVDRKGLAKILEERGKSFAIWELFQNCWDQNVTHVSSRLEPVPGKPLCALVVIDDDPDGFKDLSHAWTLFAESTKKGNPEQRGRLNLGEKLVLALCKSATIATTTGTIHFNEDDTRTRTREKTDGGSVFSAIIRMTRAEYEEVCQNTERLIAPVPTTFNGSPLPQHKLVDTFEATLQTVIADEEGNLRRSNRKTKVEIREPFDAAEGWIYEMGIPVMSTGDKFDVNVMQKVPLSLDRSSVPPAYLRQIRVEVLNATSEHLTEDDTTSTWVQDATSDERCSNDAITQMMDLRFGSKRVGDDPSDREAGYKALSKGYNKIHGPELSKGQWDNAKRAGAIKPAGQVFPTPKPYSDDPDAPPVEVIPPERYTADMRWVVWFAEHLGEELLTSKPFVRIVRAPNFGACYGGGRLDLSLQRLGHKWFGGTIDRIISLLLHEYAHEHESNHLAEQFHKEVERLAGKTVAYALRCPELFIRDGEDDA